MWRLILKSFFHGLLAFEVLMLRFQNHSNYNFILYTFRGYIFKSAPCAFRILQKQNNINPLILWANSRRGGSNKLIPSLTHFCLALATSWRHQILLYADSKSVGSCFMCIQNMTGAALFWHAGV
jgi:hypothetical protein